MIANPWIAGLAGKKDNESIKAFLTRAWQGLDTSLRNFPASRH
jgi:hypothetical protein